jgi:uncharacterized protein YgiM (DUF1202 family)
MTMRQERSQSVVDSQKEHHIHSLPFHNNTSTLQLMMMGVGGECSSSNIPGAANINSPLDETISNSSSTNIANKGNHHRSTNTRRHVPSNTSNNNNPSLSSSPSSAPLTSGRSLSSTTTIRRPMGNNGKYHKNTHHRGVGVIDGLWKSLVHSPHLISYTIISVFVVVTLQLTMNSVLCKNNNNINRVLPIFTATEDNNINNIRRTTTTGMMSPNSDTDPIQRQIDDLQHRISNLESKAHVYVEGYDENTNQYTSKFFPFVIRDSRHLVPTQTSSEFHIFDYVDITQAKQARAVHAQLFHNAHVIDSAPCQKYSVACYKEKIIQVFTYVLEQFPLVEYYFYVEADNDLCVPMTQVRDLALTEQRYFINTGIGFSGWIMSRQFMVDFLALYQQHGSGAKNVGPGKTNTTKTATAAAAAEVRPDVIASYYLTEKHAWSVTRQYWVSHTTLESLGAASLTVKDRRSDHTGRRLKLDKHLPRCLEPRRGKWKMGRKPLDPRDRFGWDYFDYDVCPQSLLFPCGGQNQLADLVAEDLKIANATGALAKAERLAAAAAKETNVASRQKRHLFRGGNGDGDRPAEADGHERLQSMIEDDGQKELIQLWKESQQEKQAQQQQEQKRPRMYKKKVGQVTRKYLKQGNKIATDA